MMRAPACARNLCAKQKQKTLQNNKNNITIHFNS